MNIFTNKHVVVALLVAPILAILSYFAIDHMVGETPHAAKAGSSYQLVEKPNCRYNSGRCGLKNGEFELTLQAEWRGHTRMLLQLSSVHQLDGVKVAWAEAKEGGWEAKPVDMQATNEAGTQWQVEIFPEDPQNNRIHLVASTNETLYFGDAAMAFTRYETAFDQDFRQ
ncbi:hypothetical protein R50073_43150 [Maricurvus nonylphenolicus]|uniref:hypothetical protein n=1 Tax=Maricurvus nonylphenolicus TaxID=1008307 RepID=UPI0036F195EC